MSADDRKSPNPIIEAFKRGIRQPPANSMFDRSQTRGESGVPLEAVAIPISLTAVVLLAAFFGVFCALRYKNRTAPKETYTIQRKYHYDAESDSENENMNTTGREPPGSPRLHGSSSGPPSGACSPKKGSPSGKIFARQSTVPLIPTQRLRQEAFRQQRQMSLQLNLANIEFSVKNVHRKEQPTLGTIRPELYRDSSQDSAKSTEQECGKLFFSLLYDHPSETITVHVIRATNLPAKDFSGTSDPYVKIYLYPDRKKKFQTKVHRKNCNPEFDETFAFSVPYKDLADKTLKFTVYDFDRFSRHDLIGEVNVSNIIHTWDLSKEVNFQEDIQKAASQEKADLGEVMFSLCYLPTACRLTLTVIKARNLKAMDITGASDPYVKVSLVSQGKRLKKKKTTVKKNTLNPVYNEAMVFDVVPESMDTISLVIAVVDYDWVGHSELIGVCEVGPDVDGPGKEHWVEMMQSPRKQIAHWYVLQESTPTLQLASMSSMKGCMTPSQSGE